MPKKKKKKPVIRKQPPASPKINSFIVSNIVAIAGGVVAMIGLSIEWLPGWVMVDWLLISLKVLCFLTAFLAAVGIVTERDFHIFFVVSAIILAIPAIGDYFKYDWEAAKSHSWGLALTLAGAALVMGAAASMMFEKRLKE
jgi:hypothetical protein